MRVERLVLDADDAKEEEAFEVVRATATRKTTKTERMRVVRATGRGKQQKGDECDDDGFCVYAFLGTRAWRSITPTLRER